MKRERIVFDTSTIISAALLRESVPRRALDAALTEGTLLVAESTLLELTSVLLRNKFDRYLSFDKREQFLAVFLQHVHLVTISEKITDCRDPEDNKFLEVGSVGQQTRSSG
ncbi:MAG: putative toxin-antitoxin system toxin component, PIN family [Chloroflexaceae bacterium]